MNSVHVYDNGYFAASFMVARLSTGMRRFAVQLGFHTSGFKTFNRAFAYAVMDDFGNLVEVPQ